MKIWVDADSCPVRVREIVERASRRTGVSAVFVSDRVLPVQKDGPVSLVEVPTAENSCDTYILDRAREGDLAVSRDVPLAAALVASGVTVLDDRGAVYTEENIGERVSLRDEMMRLREMGIGPETGRGRAGEREIRAFAAAFDRELNRLMRRDKRRRP